MLKPTHLAVLIVAAFTSAVAAQETESLRKEVQALKERVDELEEQQAKTSEKLGGRAVVQPYTARSFDFGGHVSSLFSSMHGENDSETGHVVSLVELYLRAEVDERWSLFATPGFYTFNNGHLDNPMTPTVPGDPSFAGANAGEAGMFLSRAYAQWRLGDALEVQGGVIGTPHGTTNREYFIPARTIAEASLHTRYFLGNTLYPQQVEGLRAGGKRVLGDGGMCLEYDAYFGAEDDSPDDGLGGARLAGVVGPLTVAANYGRGTRQAAAVPMTNVAYLQAPFAAEFNTGRDYQFGGVDVEWRQSDFVVRTEAYYSAERDVTDQRAFSTEWNWFVCPDWGLSYRFDYYDAGADFNLFALAVVPLGHATEHVVGICYGPPAAAVRVRLDLHHTLLPNTDDTIDFVNLSWSVSF